EGIMFRGATKYKAIEIETDTHPGFMTDWQQPFLVVLTLAEGKSVIHETVMQDRFGYTEILGKMGADIELSKDCVGDIECRFKGKNYKHSAIINGPVELVATEMTVPDIRAGLAYVIAALVADGTSVIDGVEHLERGYEDLYEKLRAIGAELTIE
ncbi:MAG: UDP-N-acetylglucosamine 1-carboxyvinyltransferase, partial [bacterium]